jgi:predicted kinase
MGRQKLIILNGFAGSGKSTIGKRYIADNPLALLIEGDELIVNMGQWLEHEPKARENVFELAKSLLSTHLSRGYDVIIPYLVTSASHIDAFRQIATECGASSFNFLLFNERDVAVARLLERGTWGEAGLDPLGEKDMPEIISLYDQMEAQLEAQKDVIIIRQQSRSIDDTYAAILESINTKSPTK